MTKYIAMTILAAMVLMGCAQGSGGSDPVDPPVVTHTLTYDVSGGNAITATVAEENTVVTLPVATKTGYTFVGWDTNADNVVDGTSVTLTADMTVKALWTINSYTITFVVETSGWKSFDSITVETIGLINYDTKKEESYHEFNGNKWYDKTTISFNVEYGAVVLLPTPEMTAMCSSDIVFDGWSKTEYDWDGTADYPKDASYTMGAGNITLYSSGHGTGL